MRGTARKAADRARLIAAVTHPADVRLSEMADIVASRATHQIEVSALDDSPITPRTLKQEPTEHFKYWSRLFGVVGTLVVHGLALNSVAGSLFAHKLRAREAEGIGSIRANAHTPPSEELVLLNLDSSQKGDSGLERSIASLMPPSIKRINALSPESFAAIDAPDMGGTSSPSADVGDPSTLALMAGRYRAQISARIERAWIRPRTPVDESVVPQQATGETPFICQVQIRQDANGKVEEVLLLNCNGTEAWRHSLVVAINQSSPLPAPPIPSVFTHELAMTFEAFAYEPGAPADEYERQAPAGAIVSSTLPTRSSAQTFDATSQRPGSSSSANQELINR